MKKLLCLILSITISTIFFTSCASNKSVKTAKEYVDEYYSNFSQKKSTQCFYQLNKNSVDILEAKYNIGAEELLSSRSRILGTVIGYEIISEEYYKVDQDKYVYFTIFVKYEKAQVNEKLQIIIKKDGQKSINVIEYDKDEVIDTLISSYKNSLIMNDVESIKKYFSSSYFASKTEKNLKNIVEQANLIGGKLWGADIIEDKYIFDTENGTTYVYEALIKLNYENDTMQNKIRFTEENGQLGIGYIVILPEKVLSFFELYMASLEEDNKGDFLNLYSQDIFEENQDKMDTKWKLLKSYEEAYGQLEDYNVLTYGYDKITDPDGTEYEAIRIDAVLNYEKKNVKHKLMLIEKDEGYIIKDQTISDE